MVLLVTSNEVKEINKAILSIRTEIENLKREIADIKKENSK